MPTRGQLRLFTSARSLRHETVVRFVDRLRAGTADYVLAGNVALAAMRLFTGLAHFFLTRGMARLLPDWLPARTAWVYATGVAELATALGLLLPALHLATGWALLLFFLLVLPASIALAESAGSGLASKQKRSYTSAGA